jgi:hypothetical protein
MPLVQDASNFMKERSMTTSLTLTSRTVSPLSSFHTTLMVRFYHMRENRIGDTCLQKTHSPPLGVSSKRTISRSPISTKSHNSSKKIRAR